MSLKKKLLNIEIIDNEKDIFIHIYESLTFYNVHLLYDELITLFNSKKDLIFDFKYCAKIDTSVLALLIAIKNNFKTVKISNYTKSIKYILSLYDKTTFEYVT